MNEASAVDAELERQYRLSTRDDAVRLARLVVVIAVLTSSAFALNDYLLLGIGWRFALCIGVRVAWVVIGVVIWRRLQCDPSPNCLDNDMCTWATALLLGSTVLSATRPSSTFAHVLVFQSVLFATYLLIPMRYVQRLVCGTGGAFAFLGVQIAVHRGPDTVPMVMAVALASIVGAVAARELDRVRRQEFRRLVDVREAQARAEEANLAKSRFLATASHDLRQPVHALGMFVGALRSRRLDDDAHAVVEHMDDSIEALDALFGALLDISSLDAGVVQPQRESFSIEPLLERIAREYTPEARSKGVRIVSYTRPCGVYSDPRLLARIIGNLVANAVRYTDAGRIVIGCRRTRTVLRVYVRDTGAGIAIDARERIFEEFYRGDAARDGRGLGLGLAIVRRLSALLGIAVRLSSHPGKGTLFSLDVPLARNVPATASDVSPALARLGPGLVLVIDDDVAIQHAMRELLLSWGLEVLVADSGVAMLAHMASREGRPRLIICDSGLRNGESGVDVVRSLRAACADDIPAVLISGDTSPERLREAEASGFLFLHKPVPHGKLRAAVGNVLRAR